MLWGNRQEQFRTEGAQPWKGLSRTFPGLFTTTNKMKMLVWRHVSWMYMYPQDSLSSQLIQTYWSYPQTNSQYILVTSQFHHTESYSIHRGVGRGACSLYVELMRITSVLRKITLGGPITINYNSTPLTSSHLAYSSVYTSIKK